MSVKRVAVVSFRLGLGDGVSNEASKWRGALETLGLEVTTIAGEGTADKILPGLAIPRYEPPNGPERRRPPTGPRTAAPTGPTGAPTEAPTEAPTAEEMERALASADVVVVENLCSLPLNPAAATVVAKVLRGRPALMHHHDLPWQRERFANEPPPPDDPRWRHVTINQLSRLQLRARGMESTVVRNAFDTEAQSARRETVRAALGIDNSDILVLQPTRAIARKNIGEAIALCEELGAVFWLLGPPEDGFAPELDKLLAGARCHVIHGNSPGLDAQAMGDVYAASDLVSLPSTWEGFGNPAVESAIHRRALAIGHYPVAAELACFGFRWFASDYPGAIRKWLERRDEHRARALLDHNHSVARTHFSLRTLPGRLQRIFEDAGWM